MSGMFHERTGVLAHWGRVPFLSRARSAFGGCIPLGSIDSGLCLSPFNVFCNCVLILDLAVACFCIAWGFGRSLHILSSPLGGFCISGHCQSLYPYCGRYTALAQHVCFSTICVLRFINNPHTLVFCLSCLPLLHCHHCSGPLAVHLGAPRVASSLSRGIGHLGMVLLSQS